MQAKRLSDPRLPNFNGAYLLSTSSRVASPSVFDQEQWGYEKCLTDREYRISDLKNYQNFKGTILQTSRQEQLHFVWFHYTYSF